jgi:MFS family permease
MRTIAQTSTSSADRAALLRDANFLSVAGSALISFFGDQFTLVALPWLVLKMTGNVSALGFVMVAMNAPRLLFLLVGGALVDRYSAKGVLLLSLALNGTLIGTLAGLVLSDGLVMWEVYALAFAIGCATAFSLPSWSTIIAQSIEVTHVALANSISGASLQIATIVGPLLAGGLIAWQGGAANQALGEGVGLAFALDFASFAVAFALLLRVRPRAAPRQGTEPRRTLRAIGDGLRYFWRDRNLRRLYLYGLTIMFFVGGPVQLAMPVLARQLGQSASAYGAFMSIFSVGSIIGVALSGFRPNFRIGNIGSTLLCFDFTIGTLLVSLALLHDLLQVGAVLLLIGVIGGFAQMMIFNWVQRRVAPALLGRIMSVCVLMLTGVPLLSTVITAWLMRRVPLETMFLCCGALLMAIVLAALLFSPMRHIDEQASDAEVAA